MSTATQTARTWPRSRRASEMWASGNWPPWPPGSCPWPSSWPRRPARRPRPGRGHRRRQRRPRPATAPRSPASTTSPSCWSGPGPGPRPRAADLARRGRRRGPGLPRRLLRRRPVRPGRHVRPDQERAAAELVRVCRPGGTVSLVNWTPEGFIGQLLKTVSKHVRPRPGSAAQPVGHRGAPAGAARRRRVAPGDHRAHLRVAVPLPGVRRVLPGALRPDPQGLRGPRRGRPAAAPGRPDRPGPRARHRRGIDGGDARGYLEVVATRA